MPSISHTAGNLTHSVAEILGGLLNSILAVFQSIFALAVNTVGAFTNIVKALFTAVVELMSGAVGFVIGTSALHFATYYLFVVCSPGNFFFLMVLGAAYWFFTTRTERGRATHQELKAKLKQ